MFLVTNVNLFSAVHLIWIIVYFVLWFFGIKFIKNKTKKFQKWFIFSLLMFGFILHFCKILFPPYTTEYANPYRKITFENICAVSTILFPLFFLSKSKTLKDYMFYIGIISGTLATFIPIIEYNYDGRIYLFELFRYYICHMIIAIAPLLMVSCGYHKLNYHRIFKVPLVLILVFCLLALNDVIVYRLGWHNVYSNFSMQFGPTARHERDFGNVLVLITSLVPSFLKGTFRLQGITTNYFPILWSVIPMFVYIPLLSFIVSLPYEHEHVKNDLVAIKQKIKNHRMD